MSTPYGPAATQPRGSVSQVTARRLLPALILVLVALMSFQAAGAELSATTGLAAFDRTDGRWFFHRVGNW